MSPDILAVAATFLAAVPIDKIGTVVLFLIGLSLVIFVHELGHFLIAKWCDVRVERFAIGFGYELFGFTRGETRYSIKALPLGGYVKMLGQEDFAVDKSGELVVKADPRSYSNKPVGQRMMIVSAGVIMNVIFAAAFFMVAFMIGMDVIPARVGMVLPDQPAFRAGLRPGDRILSINGHPTREWSDVMMRITLSNPGNVMRLALEKDGRKREVLVEPEYNSEDRLRQIGIRIPESLDIAQAGWAGGPDPEHQLQVGDTIVAVGGEPVSDVSQVTTAISLAEGSPIAITVKRTMPDGRSQELTVQQRAGIILLPKDNPSLLGGVPRLRIGDVTPGGPAERAGLRAGDVIAEWDGIRSPTWEQITEDFRKYPDFDQLVRVIRDGKPLAQPLFIRPERPFSWTGDARPQIGVLYWGEIDEASLVLAKVMPDSPMAKAGLKEQDRIAAVSGEAVSDWYGLIQAFKQNNGRTVPITYEDAGGKVRACELEVPRSLAAELGLTPWPNSVIMSIAGRKTIEARDAQGQPQEFSVSTWEGAREVLKQNVGRTVDVEYLIGDRTFSKAIEVTPDLTDPWLMHVWFFEPFRTYPQRELLKTGNPVVATWWGIKKTGYFLITTYITIKQMLFSQQLGVEHLSGPVGIVRLGTQVAESGLAELIYFLAFLSANFAVVNFLPFPIVDGGHFMFLLIEKIKGKPLSVRVQMVTQVIGLAMILGAFVFLTIQDIIMWDKR